VTRERFFVYILASRSRTLYVGVTRDLLRRLHEHREGLVPGFTTRYRVNRLVYCEETGSARSALTRERQLKDWSRAKKVRLIESVNAGWRDLAGDWFPSSCSDQTFPTSSRACPTEGRGREGSSARHPTHAPLDQADVEAGQLDPSGS
jgi:putative endonuclease